MKTILAARFVLLLSCSGLAMGQSRSETRPMFLQERDIAVLADLARYFLLTACQVRKQ